LPTIIPNSQNDKTGLYIKKCPALSESAGHLNIFFIIIQGSSSISVLFMKIIKDYADLTDFYLRNL